MRRISDIPDSADSHVALLRTVLAEVLRGGVDALPFAERFADELPNWQASSGLCHDCVDRWLNLNPSSEPVRGWLMDGEMGNHYRFVAHSMVRTEAGGLLDVTLARCRGHRRFIEHPKCAGGFFALLCANPPAHDVWVNIELGKP